MTPIADDEREQLLDTDTGRWLVITRDSRHQFDLDARTVVRHPGPGATDFGNIVLPTALAFIELCKVGERGRWQFHPRDRILQPRDYLSSVIERILPDDSDSSSGP